MTLIVAVITETGMVLGADSLVGSPSGLTQDEKIWLVGGRWGILSCGDGPPGVPAAIRAFNPLGTTSIAAAEELLALFRPSRAPMRLYVAGYEDGRPRLSRADIAAGTVEVINMRESEHIFDIWCDGVASSPIQLLGGLEYWGSREPRRMALGEAVWRTEALIRHTCAEYPHDVGLPVRLLTLLPS